MNADLVSKVFADPAVQALVGAVLVLFAAQFVSGVASAIKRGVFSQAYTSNILVTQGTAVVTIVVFAYLGGTLNSPVGALAAASAAAYFVTAQKAIRENLAELGLPVTFGNSDPGQG